MALELSQIDTNRSGQIDIVIEYPFLPSFPMPGGTDRLYLAESVAAAIQVKSNLSSQWNEVEDTTTSLRKLQRRWTSISGALGNASFYKGLATPIPYLAVAYTGYKSVESLQERLQKTSEEARPTGVLVVDSGAFVCGDTYAIGELGLYGFAVVLTQMINAVGSADADLTAYFQ